MTRIRFLLLLCLSVLTWPMAMAQPAPWPSKPIRLVIGFTAGGPTDVVGRILAQQLSERLGQQVIVDNKAGAAGSIGAAFVAQQPADGHTLYLAVQTTHAVAPFMYPNVGYDPVRDFVGIARVVHNPLLMVVHPSLPVKNLSELVAYAKANPGKLSFATGGSGSSPHMSMEMFRNAAGMDMVPVHYKGDSAAMTDLLSGRVPLMMSSISGHMANVQGGRVRPIAVSGLARSAQLPDVPTISESGFPNFEVVTWWGLVARAGTPREVVDRIHRETVAALQQPAVREQFAKLGVDVAPQGPAEFTTYIASEAQRWGGLVKSLGLKAQ